MTCSKLSCFLLLVFTLHVSSIAQSSLKRSTPEKEGVSSAGILQFIDSVSAGRNEMHSFMLLRHGKVVAEGWWNPYAPDLKHTMYSCSKSFTATAIGFAVQEKRLKPDDKVISFFPDDLPSTVSDNHAKLTVKDVLIMSDGQEPDPTGKVIRNDSNWVKGFFATPILYEPGSVFLYNSLGTYMLSAIIQKVTGQKLIDYLKPRLFDPLGITGIDWEEDTRGINTGGWGLRLKTEDMAKFAQLFLQKGNWNGKQLLPASWIEEAGAKQILQDVTAPQSRRDSSDWLQGYGYQMWRCRNNAYRGDGAFGQYMIVMPELDAVMAITSETPDMQDEINHVWKYILPAIKKEGQLPKNKKAAKQLKARTETLALPVPKKNNSALESTVKDKMFEAAPNESHIRGFTFHFDHDMCRLTLKADTATYTIEFGAGKWVASTTNKPMPSLTGGAIANTSMLYPAKINSAYTWKDNQTLELTLRYIESPHTETFAFRFEENSLFADIMNSVDFGKKKESITAVKK